MLIYIEDSQQLITLFIIIHGHINLHNLKLFNFYTYIIIYLIIS